MKRRHSLYVSVISGGPFVILRMPERFTAWRPLVRKIQTLMRDEYGLRAKDITEIQALGGYPEQPDVPDRFKTPEDPAFLKNVQSAFEGSHDRFKEFEFHAWDEAASCFLVARRATNANGEESRCAR